MFNDSDRTTIKDIINNTDLSKANIGLAWKIAHQPLLRRLLTDMPFESMLGIDAVGKGEDEWKASMILAIMYVGREDEIGEMLPPPVGISVFDFVRSCQQHI